MVLSSNFNFSYIRNREFSILQYLTKSLTEELKMLFNYISPDSKVSFRNWKWCILTIAQKWCEANSIAFKRKRHFK